jgi:hypothetical protein
VKRESKKLVKKGFKVLRLVSGDTLRSWRYFIRRLKTVRVRKRSWLESIRKWLGGNVRKISIRLRRRLISRSLIRLPSISLLQLEESRGKRYRKNPPGQ